MGCRGWYKANMNNIYPPIIGARSLGSRRLSIKVRSWLAVVAIMLSIWVGADYLLVPDDSRSFHPEWFLSILALFLLIVLVGMFAPLVVYRWPDTNKRLSFLVPEDTSATLSPSVFWLMLGVVGILAILTLLDPHRPTTYLLMIPFLGALFRDMRRKIGELGQEPDRFFQPFRSGRGLIDRAGAFIKARRETYFVSLLMLITQGGVFLGANVWQERGTPDLFIGVILGLVMIEVTQATAAWVVTREREMQATRQQERNRLLTETHIRIKDRISGAQILLDNTLGCLRDQEIQRTLAGLGAIARRLRLARAGYEDARRVLEPYTKPNTSTESARDACALQTEFTLLIDEYETILHLPISLGLLVRVQLPVSLEEALYLWAESILLNVLEHAPGAHHVSITLRDDESYVLLVVEDDGPGFIPDIPLHGLYFLKREVEDIHKGKMLIDAEPGRGTTISIRIPITPLDRRR
jgi:signal transduction histidine kinase